MDSSRLFEKIQNFDDNLKPNSRETNIIYGADDFILNFQPFFTVFGDRADLDGTDIVEIRNAATTLEDNENHRIGDRAAILLK